MQTTRACASGDNNGKGQINACIPVVLYQTRISINDACNDLDFATVARAAISYEQLIPSRFTAQWQTTRDGSTTTAQWTARTAESFTVAANSSERGHFVAKGIHDALARLADGRRWKTSHRHWWPYQRLVLARQRCELKNTSTVFLRLPLMLYLFLAIVWWYYSAYGVLSLLPAANI